MGTTQTILIGNMYKIFLGGINSETQEAPNSNVSFSSRLRNSGFVLTPHLHEADFFIAVDNKHNQVAEIRKSSLVKKRRILIKNEPVVVCPDNRFAIAERDFGLILNMGRPSSIFQNSFPWPQQWPEAGLSSGNTSPKLDKIVIINGNKISFIPGELYSLRREAIHRLENLDFFGSAWNLSTSLKIKHAIANLLIAIKGKYVPTVSGARFFFRKFSEWKGAPLDKKTVLSQYKYCLVIENSLEFLTEKLFDALFAGCIPIYVGPNLSEFPIPEGLYFQASPKLESIIESLDNACLVDHSSWTQDLNYWLQSETARNFWSANNVNSNIIEAIIEYCDHVTEEE